MPEYLQQTDAPAFPKVLWNRPVSRAAAKTITLVGGRPGDFAPVTNFYQITQAAGIGRCRVVLPDSLRPILAAAPDTTFLASGSGGGHSRQSLGAILQLAEDSAAVVIGPGLGTSSDVGMLVEALLKEITGPVVLAGDALRAIRTHWQLAVAPNRLIVANVPELLRWAGWMGVPIKVEGGDQALGKLAILQAVAQPGPADYFVSGTHTLAHAEGQFSLTPCRLEFDRSVDEAVASVFWAQNQTQPFAGLTTAAYVLRQAGESLAEHLLPTFEQAVAEVKQALI